MAQRKFLIDGGFSVNDASDITGDLTMTGNIIPTVDSDGTTGYDLGSPTMKWRDLYLSAGSLYVDGQKVLQSDAGTIVVQADPDQSLLTKTTGTGVLTFSSPNPIAIAGTLQMAAGKRITSADALSVVFGDKIDMDSNQIINVGYPSADTHAATKLYVDNLIGNIATDAITEGDSEIEIADLGTGTVGITVDGQQRFALSSTVLALTVPVTVNGVTLANTTYVDTAEADAISAANAYTDGRETAITTAYQAYADQAEVDAKAYTDTRETAINTTITTLQASVTTNATDIAANSQAVIDAIATSATDATTKANAALATAQAYTDTRETAITTAYTNAIATAVSAKDELSELADTSIGTLSGNQYLKYDSVSEAWVNANILSDHLLEGATNLFYTDARVGSYLTANSYATQAYADQAETDAKAYTDTRETAITTAYQTYANQAESDANSYTDTEVAGEAATRAAADTALDNAKVDKTGAQALHPTDALSIGGNIITLRKGDGTTETVDISPYLDDTNLSRIVSGTMNGSGIATFTRDDASTFTVDMSILLDDTNLSRITSASWNTGNGVLTLTRNDATTVTVDLDDRYLLGGNFSNFHSAVTTITSTQSATNASSTLSITFSDLTNAVHYNIYLNRFLLRPSEYSISGTTVTFNQALLATDDELEVVGLKVT